MEIKYLPGKENYVADALSRTKIEETRKNAIVEYLDYQIPVTQLKGPKGNGDMQAANQD